MRRVLLRPKIVALEPNGFKDLFIGPNGAFNRIIVYSISAGCLIATLLLAFFIRFKDFTRSYVTACLIPFFLSIISLLTPEIISSLSTSWFFSALKVVMAHTLRLILPVNMFIFMIQTWYTAKYRLLITREWIHYIPTFFFCSLFVGLCLGSKWSPRIDSSFINMVTLRIYQSELVFLAIAFVLLGFAIWSDSVFSENNWLAEPAENEPAIPCLNNSRSRVFWTTLYAVFSFLPNLIWVFAKTNEDLTPEYSAHLVIFSEWINPIYFSFCTIFFLPAMRSTLFCSQGDTKVHPAVENLESPRFESTPPSQPPPIVAGHIVDFGDVLTNPPNVTHYNPISPVHFHSPNPILPPTPMPHETQKAEKAEIQPAFEVKSEDIAKSNAKKMSHCASNPSLSARKRQWSFHSYDTA